MYYPIESHAVPVAAAYFPPETARVQDLNFTKIGQHTADGTFEKLALQLASYNPTIHNSRHHGPHIPAQFPLVVFMPGQGTTRLFYQEIVSTIASNGYIVANIDVPYDVDVVEYPDGSLVFLNQTAWSDTISQEAQLATAYLATQTRVEDVSFVLDQLSNPEIAHSLVPNLPASGLNTSYTAMFGHSLGGITAYSAIQSDERIMGGLNMDGDLFVPQAQLDKGTDKPFMFMAHTGHTRTNHTADPLLTWEQAWSTLTGWKKDIILADSQHYDFSDYPIVLETLGIKPTYREAEFALLVGTLGAQRALTIVTTYVTAFLDFVFTGECAGILDGPVKAFPEVTFEV